MISSKKKKKIFIVGAGKWARMIASIILKDRSWELAGFIDRKKTKVNIKKDTLIRLNIF